MPYYPQSPGFYPPLNSVTDGQLVDMPDGTVKGRALGAGLGDPTNLTPAQLQAILGYPVPVRHDCRFDYINTTTCRLGRYGGTQITIDAQLRTIPVAGVDLAFNTGWAPAGVVLYVYAVWTGSAITLAVDPTAPTVDPRDGNSVMIGHSDFTLVGMIVGGYGNFLMTSQHIGVLSAWNKFKKAIQIAWSSVQSGSTTPVQLAAGTQYTLAWGDEAIEVLISGYGTNSVAGGLVLIDAYINGVGAGGIVGVHCVGANYLVPQISMQSKIPAAGWWQVSPFVYVNAGTGTWTGMQSLIARG